MRIQKLLLFILVLLLPTTINAQNISGNKPIVGLLKTAQETYPHELDYSDGLAEMVESLGGQVVMVDYNELVKDSQDLELTVKKFIIDNKISRVIIPGNYYNLDSEPFPPNSNRQDVTAVITKMADDKQIYLMGICGGMQGIMHSRGIEIVKVESIQGNGKSHLISDPNPHLENVPLHQVRVNPASRLAQTISEDTNTDENGWIILYLPDAHSHVLNNSVENITKINAEGFKVVGFSSDGMIEIVEDRFGNVHFQDHPEGLIISERNGGNISSLRNASVTAMKIFFNNFISK